MNYKLAREIYSNAWYIDPVTFVSLSKTLDLVRGGQIDNDGIKANNFGVLSKSNVISEGELKSNEIQSGSIAVYNFDSVITKHGGVSHHGTKEIAAQFKGMESNDNIIGHLFKIESGGGSANAIKYIRDVSMKGARTKPLVTYGEDIMASAAMYIASDSDYIFANTKDAIVGSIGTMIELEGFKSGTEDKTGKRHIRIYASQSINKNKEFEDAINDFNYELIQKTILDPHAADFISDMEKNRPNITEIQKTGAIFKAGECLGTLIDEIGTFEMAVEKVKELSSDYNINITNKQTKKSMDKNKLKTEHSEVYAEVLNEGKSLGVTAGTLAEKNRVDAWMVFNDVDPEKVKAGIEGGNEMTKAEELAFLRASQTLEMQKSLDDSSPKNVNPDKKAGKPLTEEQKADAALDTALDSVNIPKEEGE